MVTLGALPWAVKSTLSETSPDVMVKVVPFQEWVAEIPVSPLAPSTPSFIIAVFVPSLSVILIVVRMKYLEIMKEK